MASESLPVRYALSEREYELVRRYLLRKPAQRGDAIGRETSPSSSASASASASANRREDYHAAAVRSASRVFVLTLGSLKAVEAVLGRLAARKSPTASRSRQPMVASPARIALSLSSLLYLHAMLFRLFSRLRLQLLHEKVQSIRQRYPRMHAALTTRLAPAIGASLAGFALGICPAHQLRVTAAIYVACRALELGYAAVQHTAVVQSKPAWLGSWVLFALSQGQLLHAFVFDRDCFPDAYGSFILGYTPEYIQPRPAGLSPRVAWPRPYEIVDALAQMARLKWPTFISPILQPDNPNPLPAGIDPAMAVITSRAHPAIHHLSCALIHAPEPSCFMAYLRHHLLSVPQLAKFYTMYYGALSLLRVQKVIRSPVASINRLAESILRSTMAISGSIGAAWGSICLFQALFPRSFLPQFRFVLGGVLGGVFQLLDRTPAGHMTSLYAARTSVDSFWKVGVKHGWWKGFRGGDVWLFVAALALVNVVYDVGKGTPAAEDRALSLIKVLRGEVELGLQKKRPPPPTTTEATMTDDVGGSKEEKQHNE